MKRAIRLAALLVVAATMSGCSIAGTWKVTQVTPGEAADKFDFKMVTFDSDGMYTATNTVDGEETTTTGDYKWTGGLLKVSPKDGEPRTYRGYQRIDGKLCLAKKYDDEMVTAVLTKQP